MIDWKLSARLSSIRGDAEFIVREDFADEAPRAVVVADRAPSMGLYPDDLPWLSKPAALRAVWQAVAAASVQELGLAGYLDTAAGDGWFTPRPRARFDEIDARQACGGVRRRPRPGSSAAFERLGRSRRSLPAGTFVFVCSDFLAPPSPETWLRALGVRWDAVPVVVQDPVWEQSFPSVDGLVVPFADPVTGRLLRSVRISAEEARAAARAARGPAGRAAGEFRSLGLDYVVDRRLRPGAVVACVHRLGRGPHRVPAG